MVCGVWSALTGHENDLPLALLLEGTHEWSEAEAIYRHSQFILANERLAGNDIKSENQLHMARLLTKEHKQLDAKAICSHWKNRVAHDANFALFAVEHNFPTPPLYDTPEVEIGGWQLACGLPEEGIRILPQPIQAHLGMLAPYTVLGNYYLAEGDFQKALVAERDGTTALLHRSSRSLLRGSITGQPAGVEMGPIVSEMAILQQYFQGTQHAATARGL
jgi:hypothetical protein